MKVTELMIGDWVRIKDNVEPDAYFMHEDMSPGQCVKVEEVLSNGINPDWCGGEINDYLPDDAIEPVPLTEEIIEAMDFMKIPQPGCANPHHWAFDKTDDEDGEAFDYRIKAFNTVWRGMWIEIRNCINNTTLNIQCEFVHQLQHALRLCGIDKEIIVKQ